MLLKIAKPLLLRNQKLIINNGQILISQQLCIRWKSSRNALASSTASDLNTEVKPLGEKVKEGTKTATYLGVILLGVGVTGTLFFAVFKELFSSKSPNNVYTKAANRCIKDPKIQDALGQPIITFGEETRRGRRQHVNHAIYEKNGRKHLRMRFYLKGSFRKGTVHLEMVEDDYGKYEYRYLFVDVDDMFKSTIILEDNREQQVESGIDF